MTKYLKLINTINSLIVYVKIDEWNGDSIKYYASCTLYSGTIVYLVKDFENENSKKLITKKVFDRKYMSINPITISEEITEEEWLKIIDDL